MLLQNAALCKGEVYAGIAPKFLRRVYLLRLLITVVLLMLATAIFSQTVTYKGKNVPVIKLLEAIRKQTGFPVIVNPAHLSGIAGVTINASNMPWETFLQTVIAGQPLSYSVKENTIVVFRMEDKILVTPSSLTISGTVKSGKGEPLEGASIVVLRTMQGTIANAKGLFQLDKLKNTDTLVISLIGYDAKRVPVAAAGGSVLDIVMKVASSQLDEVVMRAYGTTSQRFSTGNITRVTAEEIEKQPVMNPILALQGRVAGLNIQPSSGFASSPVRVELRGRNSLSSAYSPDPLYVVDGVPVGTPDLKFNGNLIGPFTNQEDVYQTGSPGLNGVSPLFNINPKDIQTIEVLKDASATALYGARGANGVILITTKRAKGGPFSFSVDIGHGIKKITRFRDMMNTSQYLEMRRQAFKNDGLTPTPQNAPEMLLWDTTRNTDWQRKYFGGTGIQSSVGLGFSGGEKQVQFRLNANYARTTTIDNLNGAEKQFTLNSSLSFQSTNRRFTATMSTNLSNSVVDVMRLDNRILYLPPHAPPALDEKGDLNWTEWNAAGDQWRWMFPFSNFKQPNKMNGNSFGSSLSLNYNVVDGLAMSLTLGLNSTQNEQQTLQPMASLNPLQPGFRMTNSTNRNGTRYLVTPMIRYNKYLWKGNLNISLGGNWESNTTRQHSIFGAGYTDDDLMGLLMNALIVTNIEIKSYEKMFATFGKLEYNIADKYVIDLNGRREGNANFGPGRRFGNFGSIGLAWLLSEERWMKQLLPSYVNLFKIRGSYGSVGSSNIGEYQYMAQWSSAKALGSSLLPYNGVAPLLNMHAVNNDYHWQINRKMNLGIDAGFGKNDKITLQLDVYKDEASDQLVQLPTPVYTGFEQAVANIPAHIRNSGIEASVNARIIENKQFRWTTSFNIGRNWNKLVSFPGLENTAYATQFRVGYPTNAMYAFELSGINPMTGTYQFRDFNKDGNILAVYGNIPGQAGDDRGKLIDMQPRFSGGFASNFSWNNISLSFVFVFSKGNQKNEYSNMEVGGRLNLPVSVYNSYWKQPGDQAIFARPTTMNALAEGYFQASDRTWSDASYLALNNINLAYQIPDGFAKRIGAKNASLYLSAQNIFILTNYPGMDPRVQYGGMPPVKTITANVKLQF